MCAHSERKNGHRAVSYCSGMCLTQEIISQLWQVSIRVRQRLAGGEGPMMRLVSALVIGLMAVLGFGQTFAKAQVESCPQHFMGGIPPALLKRQLSQRTQAICFEQFAVLHSG